MAAQITVDKIEGWRQTGFDLVGDPNARDRARTLPDIAIAAQRYGLTAEDIVIALHEAIHVVACRAVGVRVFRASRKPTGHHTGSSVREPLSTPIIEALETRRGGDDVPLTLAQKREVEAHLVAILAPLELMRDIYGERLRAVTDADKTWTELPHIVTSKRTREDTWKGAPEGLRSDLLRATALGCDVLKDQMPALCEWASQRGRDLALANWLHVEATVGALLELETIDEDTIGKIVDGAHPPLYSGQVLVPICYQRDWKKNVA